MEELAKHEKRILLQLARRAIDRRVREQSREIEITDQPNLKVPAGAFVTLHLQEQLRGCIGRIRADRSLEEVVQEVAMSAAIADPRFPPVQPMEVESLSLEISVLSPLREVQTPEEIEVGKHGLLITEGMQSGLLLPQVATEYGWDVETFLSQTCVKAGLPREYWREGKAKIEFFSAVVFSESEFLSG